MALSDLPLFAASDAEFARICGRSPRMIRKYRAKGRLVELDGRIAVHASMQRIRETLDPARGGRRDRLAVQSIEAQPLAPQPKPVSGPVGEIRSNETGNREGPAPSLASYHEVARLEKAERLRNLRLQNEELAGNLVRRDVVERAVFQLARDGREGLEAIVDRIGPALAAACPGLERLQVYAIIEAEHRRLAERLANAADALTVARAAAPATG